MSGLVSGLVGIQTQAAQPCVVAINSTARNNETGDGTIYVLILDNELIDQGGDFDGTSTFTAPVTGTYAVFGGVGISSVASMDWEFEALTTHRRVYGTRLNGPDGDANAITLQVSALVDMDRNDTLTLRVALTQGSKVADIATSSSAGAITRIGVLLVA